MRVAVVVVLMIAAETPARADVTLFAGTNSFGGTRPTIGISIGNFSNLLGDSAGWEFELAKGLRGGPDTYGGSILLQSTVLADWLRLYGTFGVGLYLSRGAGQRGFGSVGGGAKIQIAQGPFWLRLDDRVLPHGRDTPERLRYPQRVTAGIGLAF
jgi:hypothetical protein